MEKNFYVLLLSFITLGISAQMDSKQLEQKELQEMFMDDYVQESSKDSLIAWQEKVVLHLSDNTVDQKGTVFFKGYLLTGLKQIRLNMSNVLNVELIDENEQVVKRQYHPITDGMVNGNLELPKKLNDGKYYLRAYTRWMQNYGEAAYALTPIFIGEEQVLNSDSQSLGSEFTIAAESGKLVSGLMNRIVMKIPSSDDSKTARTGHIVDNNGTLVGEITEYKEELYTAGFEPEKGMTYELKMSDGRSYPLPKAESEGFVLQVNNLDPQKAYVRVQSTPNYVGSTVKILGSIHGVTYREEYINIDDTGELDLEISKAGIPRGILNLSLIDSQGNPLAQRPIWIEGNQLNIEVQPLESENKNESVFRVVVTDQDNNPVQTELALGINQLNEDQDVSIPTSSGFYMNNLFMGGETYAASGGFNKERKDSFLKDISLLANAPEIELISVSEMDDLDKILFPFQQGLELYGYAYDMDNNILSDTDIQVIAFSDGNTWAQELRTNSKGQIFLDDIQLNGEAKLVFRTTGDESTERMVKVIPAKNDFEDNSKARDKDIRVKSRKRIYEPTRLEPIDTTGLITLEEVIVKEMSLKRKANPVLFNYDVVPTRVKTQDPEKPKTIPQLLLGIPNINVVGLGSLNPRVVNLRAAYAGPILWVIDGFPLPQNTAGISQLVEVMNMVPYTDVDRIEFLLGPEAAVFGSRANGGVFLLYTRTGSNIDRVMRKDAQLSFQGYESELDFEEYLSEISRKERQAINSVYWDPKVKTDESGIAIIRLPGLDNNNKLYIKASTITQDGRIGVYNAPLE